VTGFAVASVLVWLISREASAWGRFDWSTFYANAREISVRHALLALLLTYAGFAVRAVRWRVFLHSAHEVKITRLLGATIVGFTGLALLGRTGELVRPYVIARQENLTVSSQIAVLALERLFDVAAAGFLIAVAIGTSSEVRSLPYLGQFAHAGLLVGTALVIGTCFAIILATYGQALGSVCERIVAPASRRFAQFANTAICRVSDDLNRIRDARSFLVLSTLSLLVWLAIGIAHFETVHAFASLQYISIPDAFLLLGFSVVGSLVSLPGGGAQQVAFAAALVHVLGVPVELAASCTILGWLLLFMAPVPVGLALLRHRHWSLQSLRESRLSCASQ
jgi:uncharacterized protein (TIRG00374 family)